MRRHTRFELAGIVVAAVSTFVAASPDAGRASSSRPIERFGFSDFRISPSPFSPAFSPGKKDVASFRARTDRAVPLLFRISSGDAPVVEIPPRRTEWLAGDRERVGWRALSSDGLTPLPSGRYVVDAICPLTLERSAGSTDRDSRSVIENPYAVAADESGRIFAASRRSPLQVFSPDGAFLRSLDPACGGKKLLPCVALTWGDGKLLLLHRSGLYSVNPETGEGTLLRAAELVPRGITDRDLLAAGGGRIALGSRSTGRVYLCAPDGSVFRTVVTDGPAGAPFTDLRGVALLSDGGLWVTSMERIVSPDTFAPLARRYDAQGNLVADVLPVIAGGSFPMPSPGRVAALDDGSAVIASAQPFPPSIFPAGSPFFRIFARVSASGDLVATWGDAGSAPGSFDRVTALAVSGSRIVAADGGYNHRLVVMNASGDLLGAIATPPERFVDPIGAVRTPDGGILVADRELDRCVRLDASGDAVSEWRVWGALRGMARIDGLFEGRDGTALVACGWEVLRATASGDIVGRIELPRTAAPPTWGGAFEDASGDLWASERAPAPLRVFSRDGALLGTIAPVSEARGFFGPLCSGEGGVWAQCRISGDRERTAAVLLDPATRVVARTVPFEDVRNSGDEADPFMRMDFGFLRASRGDLHAFGSDGRGLWSLGGTQGEGYTIAAVLAQSGDITLVERNPSHPSGLRVETWSPRETLLGRAEVVADNEPPVVRLDPVLLPVPGASGTVTLTGTIADTNPERYVVSWASRKYEPRRWSSLAAIPMSADVRGILARWSLSRAARDAGIDVRVSARDAAWNENGDEIRIAFDEDGDGFSNEVEVSWGTDPHRFTTIGSVDLEVDLDALLRPYSFADVPTHVRFRAFDAAKKELTSARISVSADAGALTGTNGSVTWTPPPGDGHGLFTVSFPMQAIDGRIFASADASFSLRYAVDGDRDWRPDAEETASPASGDVFASLPANPDTDGDGVPDGLDLVPGWTPSDRDWSSTYLPHTLGWGTTFRFYGLGGAKSSVSKYGSSATTKAILRSDAVADGDKMTDLVNRLLSGVPLAQGDDRTILEQVTDYLRSSTEWMKTDRPVGPSAPSGPPPNLMDAPGGGEPWRAIRSTLRQIPTDNEEYLGRYVLEGLLHPTTVFDYYSLESEMDVTVGNVAWIDGRVGTNPSADTIFARPTGGSFATFQLRPAVPASAGGIHRNFLVASFPGSEGRNDRKLTIQWRIVSPYIDRTAGNDTGTRTRPAWFVQVFHANDFVETTATLIRTRPPFSSETLTLFSAPWYRALYEGVIEGRPAGMNVYEGSLEIPGIALFPSPSYVVRMTPFWLVVKEGPLPCPLDNAHTIPANREDCLSCRGSVRRRYGEPIDRFDLKVSGVTVEARLGSIRWIYRRTGHAATLTSDAMRAVADVFPKVCIVRDGYALMKGLLTDVPLYSGSGNLTVGGLSVAWMDRPPPDGLGGNRDEAATRLNGDTLRRLTEMDAVFMYVPNAALGDLAMERIPWTSGTWYYPGSDGERLFDGLWIDVVRTDAARRGVSWRRIPFWDGFAGDLSGRAASADAISILRPVGSGRMLVRTDSAVSLSGDLAAKTTSMVTVGVGETTEAIIDECDASRVTTAVKIAAVVADDHPSAIFLSDGINVTSCLAEGDAVGAMICSLSAGAKMSKTLLSSFLFRGSRLQGSLWAKGLDIPVLRSRTFASAGCALNVAGAVAGALEIAYWIHRYNRTDDILLKQEAVRQAVAVGIDTGIGIMPQGSLILIPWTVSALATQQILRELGFGLSPLAEKMVTPGQSLTTLALHLLPKSVSKEEADMVAELAQKDAIGRCTNYNRDPARKATYIYIPPGY
jgi:hypothetical protein